MSDQVLQRLIGPATTNLETTPDVKARFGYAIFYLTFSQNFSTGTQVESFRTDMFAAFRRARDFFNAGPNQAVLSNDPMPSVKKNHFDGLQPEDPTIDDDTGLVNPAAVLQCEDLSRNVKKVFPPRQRAKEGVQQGMIRLTARNKFGVFWTVWVERRHQDWWNNWTSRQAANQAQTQTQTQAQGSQVKTDVATQSTAAHVKPQQPGQVESTDEVSNETSSLLDPRLLQQPQAHVQNAPVAAMSAGPSDAASTIDPRLLQQPQSVVQNAPVANMATNVNSTHTDVSHMNSDALKKIVTQSLTLTADYHQQLRAIAAAALQELDRINGEAGNAVQEEE